MRSRCGGCAEDNRRRLQLACGQSMRRARFVFDPHQQYCRPSWYENPNRECRVSSAIDPIGWYDAHSDRLAGEYEAMRPDQVHAWLSGLLPAPPALVFDIGA